MTPCSHRHRSSACSPQAAYGCPAGRARDAQAPAQPAQVARLVGELRWLNSLRCPFVGRQKGLPHPRHLFKGEQGYGEAWHSTLTISTQEEGSDEAHSSKKHRRRGGCTVDERRD